MSIEARPRSIEDRPPRVEDSEQLSLSTRAARNLATTTKSEPQMQAISSRWLTRMLPWVQVSGGTYRVNRRRSYRVGDGRLTFITVGSQVRVVPAELGELPVLRGFADETVLTALADRLHQREYRPGEVIARAGSVTDQVYLIAHGKVSKVGTGRYGDPTHLGVLADGQFFGERALVEAPGNWDCTVRAMTGVTVLALPRQAFNELLDQSAALREHVARMRASPRAPHNRHGEAAIEITAGHQGEPELPGTFVDYELGPREYGLSVAQTVLRVHSRVADLYDDPMDQTGQQLRLTIEALRERQESELVNNRDFGLLHNADVQQRIHTRSGPPTPDDLDELLSMRRGTRFLLAHPKAIAAFFRECNSRGLYPDSADVNGHRVPAWRSVPIFPSGKIPVSDTGTSSILAMRVGEDDQGVIGLHRIGLPDEAQPGLNVRFMGVDDKAIFSYLVSAYYSAAVLVPDALGILENVAVGC